MKQPLKEMLKKIGGGHLLTEVLSIEDHKRKWLKMVFMILKMDLSWL